MLPVKKFCILRLLLLMFQCIKGTVLAQEIEIEIISSEAKSWYKDETSDVFTPSKAYDGDYNTFYSVKDDDTYGNFLSLFLERVYWINRVVLTNRLGHCCQQRILDTAVEVRVTAGGTERDTGRCGTITEYDSKSPSDQEKQTFTMECRGVLGNMIHITDLTPGKLGHGISEVKIYGVENVISFDLDEYYIKKVDGPAAGLVLSSTSTLRNEYSYYVHTQQHDDDDQGELWKITHKDYKGKTCYNIQPTSGVNAMRMLAVHSDVQQEDQELGRAIVHSTPWKPDDECWTIDKIPGHSGAVYRLTKTWSREKGKRLISDIRRDDDTYWVDASLDRSDVLWEILSTNLPMGL